MMIVITKLAHYVIFLNRDARSAASRLEAGQMFARSILYWYLIVGNLHVICSFG